jgi:hypothetical protein
MTPQSLDTLSVEELKKKEKWRIDLLSQIELNQI